MQVVFDEPEPAPVDPPLRGPLRWWPLALGLVTVLVVAGVLLTRHGSQRADGRPPVAPSTPTPVASMTFEIVPVVLVSYALPGVVEVYSPDPWQPDPTDTTPGERRFVTGAANGSPTVTLAAVGAAGAGTIWDETQRRTAELTAHGDTVVRTVFTAMGQDGTLGGDLTWNGGGRHVVERNLLHEGRLVRVSVAGPLADTNAIDALFAAVSLNGMTL